MFPSCLNIEVAWNNIWSEEHGHVMFYTRIGDLKMLKFGR
jgi:hypothetical protein